MGQTHWMLQGMEHYTITHVLDIPGQTDTLPNGSYRGRNITLQYCTCFEYTRTDNRGQTDRHLHLWKLQGTEYYTFTHVFDIPGQTDTLPIGSYRGRIITLQTDKICY